MSDVECLNCRESKAVAKANQYHCATVDYFGECNDEWPKHRWADWNDKELSRYGILPEHYDKYRRTNVHDFQYIKCAHRGRDHTTIKNNDYVPDTVCVACWADTKKGRADDQD